MAVRFPFHPRRSGLSLIASGLLYAFGVTLAAGVTVYGVHRVAHAMAGDLRQPLGTAVAIAKPVAARSSPERITAPHEPTVVREASMTPTQDRWSRSYSRRDYSDRSRYAYGPEFGTSSRGSYRRGSFDSVFGSDSEWDRPRNTYRTVCVRTCDGYYFPISFSVTPDRFEHDRQACENSCGAQGRLFVYRNPGGELEDMQDLQGRPYRQMRTAFLYRTEYVAGCKCKPHPWEQQARDQHRVYALTAAKRKGDKTAAAALAALETQMRQTSADARPTRTARWSPGSATDEVRDPERPEQRGTASEAELMRLGGQARAREQEAQKQQRKNREADWVRDLWGRGN